MMNIKGLVQDKNAVFDYYADGNLWYKTVDIEESDLSDAGFTFPIPIEDTKGAVFNHTHKAITLMRWIRKHVELLETGDQGC